MTEIPAEGSADDTNEDQLADAAVPLVPEDTDWSLSDIIRHATIYDVGASVTLFTGGLMISGEIITGGKFFRSYGTKLLDQAKNVGLREGEVSYAQVLGEHFIETADSQYPEAGDAKLRPFYTFIHLENVEVRIPGNSGTASLPSWRGKLSEVSGWCLGTLTVGKG